LLLVDLDQTNERAPALRQEWLPNPAQRMCFRVAVRKVESWLLADREAIARFLGIQTSRVPAAPDAEPDPAMVLMSLAARSTRREIRLDMVPAGGGRRGAAYPSRLMEFASTDWNPSSAEACSESLRRCMRCVRQLVQAA
jgi:hypothetical protein